ncbi:hypothetical protein TNCV_2403831, partial [Trichonephila clavipes]
MIFSNVVAATIYDHLLTS